VQDAVVRLERWLVGHRKLVIGLWLAAVAVAAPFSYMETRVLTQGGFQASGSDSYLANQALQRDFGARQPQALGVALVRRGATPEQFAQAVTRYAIAAGKVAHIEVPGSAVESARVQALSSSRVLFPLTVVGNPDQSADAAVKLREQLGSGQASDGVVPYLVGDNAVWAALHKLQTSDVAKAERIGVPITAVILLATFGSLAAAALPLVLGMAAVVITGAIVYFLAQALPMSIYVTSASEMIGIGVAIDYSLFVLARYRQQIATGSSEEEARRVALQTSGVAVMFSGTTVVLALCALLAFPTVTLRSMALGSIIVVAMAVLAAVTLMPAVISVLGRRVYAPGRIAALTANLRGGFQADFWSRWTRRVMRRPAVSFVLAAGVMLALAAPATQIKFSEQARSQLPAGSDAIQGMNVAARLIGPGALTPIQAVIRFHSGTASAPANRAALSGYASSVENDPEVSYVAPPRLSLDGREVDLAIVPRHYGEEAPVQALIDRLRSGARSSALAPVAAVDFGGDVALVKDFTRSVSHGVWRVFGLLVALTFVVMLVMLRSMVLPLKAVLMNLLTVAAASGVIVGIFQWGWLDWTGYHPPGYIDAAVIPLMLAVVFGLSMDYEVFMLTRIREAFIRTGDNRGSVATGLRTSAGTITSAALIMVTVFFAFAAVAIPSIREIGTALGVAIILDATVVRLILVPATMALLGRWNWWFPRRAPAPVAQPVPEAGPRAAADVAVAATAIETVPEMATRRTTLS
jgi:uncharacterized membrane protein YdfJ with MMPL/SSD domain